MFNIDKKKFNKIMLTRGDSASILVEIYDLEDKKYDIKPTDTVALSVWDPKTEEIVISKFASEDHYIVFAPADTKTLSTGLYQYDVQLTTSNGNIYTVVPPAIFEITSEVSN